jgi:DNA mismatch repair protein MutS2
MGTHSDKMGQLLLDLEKRLSETEQARKTYEEVRLEAEKSQRDYETRASELRREKAKKLEEAYLEAERILKSANQRIEQAVETIVQQGRIDRTQIKVARLVVEREKQQIAQKKNRVRAAVDSSPHIRKEDLPPIGSMIGLEGSTSEGELVEVEGQYAVLMMNGLRIKTPLNKLRLSKVSQKISRGKRQPGKKITQVKSLSTGAGSGVIPSFLDQRVSLSLDLRGKRGDAAIKELTHYLDQVMAKGLPKVEVIHGTGEGILMKLVADYLSKRKGVKKFETAPYDQGGPGKTIVTLE